MAVSRPVVLLVLAVFSAAACRTSDSSLSQPPSEPGATPSPAASTPTPTLIATPHATAAWSFVRSSPTFDESGFSDIAATTVAVIAGRHNDVPTLWFSADGEAWTATVLDPSHDVYAQHVTVSEGQWIVAGVKQVQEGFEIRLWSSANGSTWAPVDTTGLPTLRSTGRPDVQAVGGPRGFVAIATTADVTADGSMTSSRAIAFTAAGSTRWTAIPLPGPPSKLPMLGVYRLAVQGNVYAALGIACRGPVDNPPCRFMALTSHGGAWTRQLSPVIDEGVFYLDNSMAAAAGRTGFAVTGTSHTWLIGPAESPPIIIPTFSSPPDPPARLLGLTGDEAHWYALATSADSLTVVESLDATTWSPASTACCQSLPFPRGFAILAGSPGRAIVMDSNYNQAGTPVGLMFADLGD